MKDQEPIITKEKTGKVYKITSPSNRIYIGSTRTPINNRWSKYKNISCTDQIRLYNSLKKYGWDSHVKVIIWEGSLEEMFKMERILGEKFNVLGKRGLNCQLPGYDDIPPIISEYTRRKLSKINKGRIPKCKSLQHRKNISESKKGNKCVHSNEYIKKLYESRCKPVLIFDINWNFIVETSSTIEAAKYINGSASEVCKSCNNQKTVVKKHRFKYKNFYEQNEEIKQIDPYTGKLIKIWNNIDEAAFSMSISFKNIKRCATKKSNTSFGFKWEYVDENYNTSFKTKSFVKSCKKRPNRSREIINVITEKNKKAINIYDLNGKFIRTFDSVKDASIFFNSQSYSIIRTCKGDWKKFKNYQIRYRKNEDDANIDSYKKEKMVSCIEIYQLDKNTNHIIKKWESVSQAAKELNTSTSFICRALKNSNKTAYGFKWRYVNELPNK